MGASALCRAKPGSIKFSQKLKESLKLAKALGYSTKVNLATLIWTGATYSLRLKPGNPSGNKSSRLNSSPEPRLVNE